MEPRKPFKGLKRKLVLAFDLGTTYSGISYSILDPGQIPEIKGVTRFPAHEQVSGASKIPTIIYYDPQGNVCAVGAEALREGVYEMAEDGGWVKAEWFKLHIRPQDDSAPDITSRIPPLPLNKSVVDVVADFLQYLYQCASSYIQDTHANGVDLWRSVQGDIDFVLSHPNGWEGYQQSQIRRAVVAAGLIPDTENGHSRVSFVTEGEASLHFAIRNGLPTAVMEKEEGVVIVDAGGGTVDISTYSRKLTKTSKNFEEIAAPQCHFNGSVFVSIHARLFLEELLSESQYLDDLDHIVRTFDKTTKIRFSDVNQPQYIKFGSTRDNDESCNIRFGQLKLSGAEVASFFQSSVQCIIDTIKGQCKDKTQPIAHVVLVGGFAASNWLFSEVQGAFKGERMKIVRPEIHVNKAVSDGAISFYLDHVVTARIAKYSYGTFQNLEYIPTNPEHEERMDKMLIRASGRKLIPDAFVTMLAKDTRVSEETEVRRYMWTEVDLKAKLKRVTFDVYCYKGDLEDPKWYDLDPSGFKKLYQVEVDFTHLPLQPEPKKNGQPGVFYTAKYWVVLLFNSVELKAQMLWLEDGVEKRTSARLIFYQDT